MALCIIFMVSSCQSNHASDGKNASNEQSPVASAEAAAESDMTSDSSCCDEIPENPRASLVSLDDSETGLTQQISYEGMVLIPAGEFEMGANGDLAFNDEYPKHKVQVSAFWMDEAEVTNAQFAEFVEATGYITVAEKPVDWAEAAKTLPPGTPKPHDSILAPGSLVFRPTSGPVNLSQHHAWWHWVNGADWRHPQGPGSNIDGLDDHPVVHVCWDDAAAYATWAGKRLPTEAEWEWAARGGIDSETYPWGSEHPDDGLSKANYWEGEFPYVNAQRDGYVYTAPVKSYPPNAYGLYEMSGNVWEWCADWYHAEYYQQVESDAGIRNPRGPLESYDPAEPLMPKKVSRGGSFLCNDSYCAGYRVSSRMKASRDSGHIHTGFRCVRDAE
jgi:formylglycine-generating enzyme required for sulfatase activity